MSSHLLRAVALAAAALLPAPWAVAAPLSLDQAIELAVQRSQMTRSAHAGALSAAEMARAAGQQADPMLNIGIDNLPVTGSNKFSTGAEDMTMKRIGIVQEWVSAEKRSAREAAAQATAGRESVMEKVAAAEARMQTAMAYVEAYYAGQALALTTLNEMHAREELEAGKGRLATAAGSSGEVLALAQRGRKRRGRVRRHAPAAKRGRRRPAAMDGNDGRRARRASAGRRADAGPVRRRPPVGRRPAARHRGDAPGGPGHPAQPPAELDLRALVRAATRSTRPHVVRGQHPADAGAGRAPGPRNGGQAGARRQGRGRARGGHGARQPANTRRWRASPHACRNASSASRPACSRR